MGVFSMGAEPTVTTPSKVTDTRAVAYDQGLNVTGNKNKVAVARDQASQFAGASNFSILDGGAIARAFDFAESSLQKSHDEIAGFAAQAGQFLTTATDVAAVESSPEAAKLTTVKLLLWPAVALLAFWIWKAAK